MPNDATVAMNTVTKTNDIVASSSTTHKNIVPVTGTYDTANHTSGLPFTGELASGVDKLALAITYNALALVLSVAMTSWADMVDKENIDKN